MARTLRWLGRCLAAGLLGVLANGEPARADGWLRSRCRSLYASPTTPWMPAAEPSAVLPIAPSPDVPALPPPVIDNAPPVPQGKIEAPPAIPAAPFAPVAPQAAPAEPRYEPLVSAALGDSGLAVAFSPAMFGDLNGLGSIPTTPSVTAFNALALSSPVLALAATAPSAAPAPAPTPVTPTTPTTPVTPQPSPAPAPTPTPAPTPARRTIPPHQRLVVQIPQLSYGSFKISENESPRPTDRIFVTYNYYNGLPTSSVTPSFDVHRETVGFEKTFLDGRASVGVRVPFLQLSGPDNLFSAFNIRDGQFGDVSVITKYAFYDDRTTGNLISGGLMVTAPTGENAYVVNGQQIHSTLLQPWAGTIWTLSDRFFVQGFSSIVVPTDDRDVTAWYNDIGIGYWLRRGKTDHFFHGIVPTFEAHVGTPLNHRGVPVIDQVHVPDYVSLVGGVNFIFGRNSSLGIAAGAPVTGARPWDFETHVSLNFRF